ncbi:hypothetical protein LZ554_003570 [Drepanopeziza brunnea f. sp. 'monogermtubi']|nr:hypothetical protein LZ554_003570 [Drepanopeziza brunnea f. sp. 'monogermtubi']
MTNENKKPYMDETIDQERRILNVLGPGYYTRNKAAEWIKHIPGLWGSKAQWYCVIEADMDEFEELSKVWIPESYSETDENGEVKTTDLWTWDSDNEADIHKYIQTKDVRDPKNTILFSAMRNEPGEVQMVIPTGLLGDDDLDFSAQCFETLEELGKYSEKTVDWMSWDIVGKPQPRKKASWYKKYLGCIRGSSTCE